jgi:hypothetical protein
MLQVDSYEKDCLRYTGKVLLHESRSEKSGRKAYSNTMDLWNNEFHENMENRSITSTNHVRSERVSWYCPLPGSTSIQTHHVSVGSPYPLVRFPTRLI